MKSGSQMYETVQEMAAADDTSGAIRKLEEILQSRPEFGAAHYDLGALYSQQGDRQRALHHYQTAVSLEPGNAAYLKSLGDFCYTAMDDMQEAVRMYRRVTAVDPTDVDTWMILGNLSVVDSQFDEAERCYRTVLDIEPWNHDALLFCNKLEKRRLQSQPMQDADRAYAQSQQLVQSGDLSAAIETLENLIGRWPDYAPAHNDLGVLYYQIGATDKSLARYREATRLRPHELTYQKNLADYYCIEQGRVEEALELYLQVLREDPTDVETLMAAGYICRAVKRERDAKVFFERVLDLEPWNLEANDSLDRLHDGHADRS